MRRTITVLAALALVGAAGFWVLTAPSPIDAAALPAHEPDVERGRLVFAMGGCASCHAAPGSKGDDRNILRGGVRLKTDFGTFVAPNISPDPQYGIGTWSAADLINAMQRGISPDGSHYYPAFPFTSYARMDVTDIIDLKAHIDTLPPSATPSAQHELSFPFTVRRGLGLWKLLYLSPAPVLPQSVDPKVALGQKLVEGAGHCGECHTPRNAIGGPDTASWLSGAPNPEGPGRIPNITSGKGGLSGWSEGDIAYYLETGFTPDFDSAGGSMVDVIQNTAQIPAEWRDAIAAYLKSVPPHDSGG